MDQNYQPYDNQNHDPVQGGDGGYDQQPSQSNGKAIAALVLGIVGIVMSIIFALIGVVCSIAGLILSIQVRKQTPSGIATAGFICSIVGLVFGIANMICGFAIALM